MPRSTDVVREIAWRRVLRCAAWCGAALAATALFVGRRFPVQMPEVAAAPQRSASAAVSPGGEIPWIDGDTGDPTLISLGPVGARAKTDHLLKGLPESHSSSGVIKFIFKNGPAEGRLQLGDVITGVNGAPFNQDFSRRMGAAIDASEGTTGKLSLSILRGGNRLVVDFNVPKIGSFSKTFPYNCKKSDAILEAACDWLARHQWPNGKLEGGHNSGYSVCTAVTGLAMLGSGNRKYTANISLIVNYFLNYFDTKRTVDGHFGPTSTGGWQVMYGAMFLSEYYLATGDRRIPPVLAYLNKEIEYVQFRNLDPGTVAVLNTKFPTQVVPPYWFGHGRIDPEHLANPAYFHLGVNTANALVAWGLIDKCGVPIDRQNYTNTLDYVQVACPSGQMAYNGRPNQRGADHDAFGRTGVLAMACALDKGRAAYSRKVAAALQWSCLKDYYTSHSSESMGKVWGSLGIAALDPKLFRQVMDNYKYDYDLTRLHDGRFVYNPAKWAEASNPHFDLKGATGDGHRWTTAFNALLFALGKQRLRLTGGSLNIPGVDPAKLKGELRQVFHLIRDLHYERAAKALRKFLSKSPADAEKETAEALMAYVANFTQPEKADSPEYRTWTDASGKHHLEAALVGTTADGVTLRKKDGSEFVVSVDQLSKEDQQWLQKRK